MRQIELPPVKAYCLMYEGRFVKIQEAIEGFRMVIVMLCSLPTRDCIYPLELIAYEKLGKLANSRKIKNQTIEYVYPLRYIEDISKIDVVELTINETYNLNI